MSVKHSSQTNEQYTPQYILDPVREVLGEIDLDPASSELANKQVKAKKIFTAEDGIRTFEEDWKGWVFMNPPGGKRMVMSGTGMGSNPALFWAKLMYEWNKQHVQAAIVLGFTIEVLQTTQNEPEYPMLRFPFCVPSKRIPFDVPREEKLCQLRARAARVKKAAEAEKLLEQAKVLEASAAEIVSGEDPPHGNVIVLVPPFSEHYFGDDKHGQPWVSWGGPTVQRFQRAFSPLGYVRV